MSMPLDQEGFFRLRPVDKGLHESKRSEALAMRIRFQIIAKWNGVDWDDWTEYEVEHEGFFYFVDGKGELNLVQVNSLMEATLWSGDMEELDNPNWRLPNVVGRVKREEYEGKPTFKFSWLFPNGYEPSLTNVTPKNKSRYKERYGHQLKALAKKVFKEDDKPPVSPESPAPAALESPLPLPPSTEAAETTREEAWKGFCGSRGDIADEDLHAAWRALIASFKKPEEQFMGSDWAKVEKEQVSSWVEDIPF